MSEEKKQVRDKLISDCFGNVSGRKNCCVLTEDVCLYHEKCPFYKTRKQYEADRKKYDRAVSVSNTSNSRRIRCIDSGKIYPSVKMAALKLGISQSSIHLVLSGRQKETYGMRFEYVEDV